MAIGLFVAEPSGGIARPNLAVSGREALGDVTQLGSGVHIAVAVADCPAVENSGRRQASPDRVVGTGTGDPVDWDALGDL